MGSAQNLLADRKGLVLRQGQAAIAAHLLQGAVHLTVCLAAGKKGPFAMGF